MWINISIKLVGGGTRECQIFFQDHNNSGNTEFCLFCKPKQLLNFTYQVFFNVEKNTYQSVVYQLFVKFESFCKGDGAM